MTKIEELKAAYEAATPGEWETACHHRRDGLIDWDVCEADGGDMIADLSSIMNGEANAKLITIMHNNLPALLEAVEALESLEQTVRYLPLGVASIKACENASTALEKLQ